MPVPDYSGARAANAGNSFHELWALRQALRLLDPNTDLVEVTIEGLRIEDEAGKPSSTWDGVDCALYFASPSDAAQRIEIAQLKYSPSDPRKKWTIARLTQATNRNRSNSVIGRLAAAFLGLQQRPRGAKAPRISSIRLVSNQPVSDDVVDCFATINSRSGKRNVRAKTKAGIEKLKLSGSLADREFARFAKVIDFSECGSDSRFGLEQQVLSIVSSWVEVDASSLLDTLLMRIRQLMKPEGKGQSITRQSLLGWFDVSDSAALFPCPSLVGHLDYFISRQEVRNVLEDLQFGHQYLCIHGEGGCGKTTAIQEIRSGLPSGSVVIVYDCYGNGQYLHSGTLRHRPADAFLQICNDLASQLQVPLFLDRTRNHDYPRVFNRRIKLAAEVVRASAPDALLVLIVDAADNAVAAAAGQKPPEKSFISDVVSLGGVPSNVRIVLTARSGRLQTLDLPRNYRKIQLKGFTPEETKQFATHWLDSAPARWTADFHKLTGANPRVQHYALSRAERNRDRAIDVLIGVEKSLKGIFEKQFDAALLHAVGQIDMESFCATLTSLPHPVPLDALAAITKLGIDGVKDICLDLIPGVHLTDRYVSFADEDFESFVDAVGVPKRAEVTARIADYFHANQESDEYAAVNLASALFDTHRAQDLLALVSSGGKPKAISDPILQRTVQIQRLRLAAKASQMDQDPASAVLTLLSGAAALKTDFAVQQLLLDNPDLTARFAPDQAVRGILRNPDAIERQGALLFHLLTTYAHEGDVIAFRGGSSQLDGWLRRRALEQSSREELHQHSVSVWPIRDADVGAQVEAVLRLMGPCDARRVLARWSPRQLQLRVTINLAFQLVLSGDTNLLSQALQEKVINSPWDVFPLTALQLAGIDVDVTQLVAGIRRLYRHNLLDLDSRISDYSDEREQHTLAPQEVILTACEAALVLGGSVSDLIPVLEVVASRGFRKESAAYSYPTAHFDLVLRARSLTSRLAGVEFSQEAFWEKPSQETEKSLDVGSQKVSYEVEQERRRAAEFADPYIRLHDVRAQIITGAIPAAQAIERLEPIVVGIARNSYRLAQNHSEQALRRKTAIALARLFSRRDIDRPGIMRLAMILVSGDSDQYVAGETEVLSAISLQSSLHEAVLEVISNHVDQIKAEKISSDEKCEYLAKYARLLLRVSPPDARTVFQESINIAEGINADTVHELGVLLPLAQVGAKEMSLAERRMISCSLATCASDASVRLSGQSSFPWTQVFGALSTLDLGLALAAVARWEDAAFIDRDDMLSVILETGLETGTLLPTQCAALVPLLDSVSPKLLASIVAGAKTQRLDASQIDHLSEELAREELLRFGQGRDAQACAQISSLCESIEPNYWASALAKARQFCDLHASDLEAGEVPNISSGQIRPGRADGDPLENIDWSGHRLDSGEDIEAVLGIVGLNDLRYPFEQIDVLDRLQSRVAIRDRLPHIVGLCNLGSSIVSKETKARAIFSRLKAWQSMPAIQGWMSSHLLDVIRDDLPEYCWSVRYDDAPFRELLALTTATPNDIVSTLIQGVSDHLDDFSPAVVYTLIGILVTFLPSDVAASILQRYVQRLVDRVHDSDREVWDAADIPVEPGMSLARYLYALMSDVDVHIRWRAAHAIRALGRLDVRDVLDRLIDEYPRQIEKSFRRPEAPFYWLAARLWLLRTVDRMATESPMWVSTHGKWLTSVALDRDFPHLLIRMHAKSAVEALLRKRMCSLRSVQRNALKQILGRSRRAPNRVTRRELDRFESRNRQPQRRFDFNLIDTIPYWYLPACHMFANVTMEDFLAVAESWIVDRWGVSNQPWLWANESRQNRLNNYSMDNRHGTHPSRERYQTYLEYHAMYCTVGALLQRRALAKTNRDDVYQFEDWLQQERTTLPGYWLADVRNPKPLDLFLWHVALSAQDCSLPVPADRWLSVLLPSDAADWVVVAADFECYKAGYREKVRVMSSLVSPEASSALIRALQSMDESSSHRLPWVDDRWNTLHEPPYDIQGWLEHAGAALGVDEHDPMRYGVVGPSIMPGRQATEKLSLKAFPSRPNKWQTTRGSSPQILFESWGDTRGDEKENVRASTIRLRTQGWRLRILRSTLLALLSKHKRELIVATNLDRDNTGYEYTSAYTKDKKESKSECFLLLRRDCSIEGSEGRLGAWVSPGT